MNKNVIEIYNQALKVVLEDYDIAEEKMFTSNEPDCVGARVALIVALHDEGLTDKEIAECTHKMRRCSVCLIRNRYAPTSAHWEVKMCIEHIKKMRKNY